MVREEERQRGRETAITFLSEKFLLKRIVQGVRANRVTFINILNRFQISSLNCEVKM